MSTAVRRAALGALLGLLLLIGVAPTAASADPPRATISVMTFNLFQLPWIANTNTADKQLRAGYAASVIRRENTDVVVLEEAFSDQATAMRNDLRTEYPYQTPLVGKSCSTSGGWTGVSGNCSNSLVVVNGGVTILSKLPITASYQHVYAASQMWTADYYSNKGVALAKLTTAAGPVWIAGTHLQADESASGRAAAHVVRMQQLAEAKSLITAKTGSDPVILAGDLNVENYAGASRLDGLGRNELQQAEAASGATFTNPAAYGYSYDAVTNPLATPAGYRDTLDYVGVRTGGLATVGPGSLVGYAPGAIASDHYPVRATVSVP